MWDARRTAIAAALLLAGCGGRVQTPDPAEPPPEEAPAVIIQPPLPAADGTRVAALWRLRSALNVAALSCREPADAPIAPAYNAFLKRQAAALAEAQREEEARFRAAAGEEGWRAASDAEMTRLYNYYGDPQARAGFCATARTVAGEIEAVEATALNRFAKGAVERLDAPVEDARRVRADYARALAGWEAKYGPVAAPAAPAVSKDGGWQVQLGAFADRAAAETEWARARGKLAAVAALTPSYRPAPGRTLLRLRAGPLADRAAATALCAKATKAGLACLPAPPE